jgi:hypothetical protein
VLRGCLIALANKYKQETPSCKIKITPYFIRCFKKRHNVAFKNLCGEAKSAVTDNILDFFEEYEVVKKDYCDEDVFNLDETGLYIKNFGKRSYVICGDDDKKSVKTDKTRISLLLCGNRFGEEMNPLMIGKSANPRAFKHSKPEFYNLIYSNNASSWLTKDIFIKYLTKINENPILKNRKILILLDNFSGHEVSDFSNIKLLFFPPNTTYILQPLDLGIISAIKLKYTEFVSNYITTQIIDNEQSLKSTFSSLSLLNDCNWIREAIKYVNTSTFSNCWDKFLSMKDKLLNMTLEIGTSETSFEAPVLTDDPTDTELIFDEGLPCIDSIVCDTSEESKLGLLNY